ncbi:hypothetical protein HOU90_gp049 [Lactobacillus phage Lpa804]|uniref:Uncharacterized protein n=1 Tax=Lactobacillus phage Lpa804 TaxID=2059850 RepID=A0A3S6QA97_9CAUD|nr:hypothetical protein HOU90_gp049 [Lactobacillus phage Lpa804]AUG84675.1 hypothetical protein Lpa804_88 [Lactobacillus phage Lpa804]
MTVITRHDTIKEYQDGNRTEKHLTLGGYIMAAHFSELNSLIDLLYHNNDVIGDTKVTSIHKGSFNEYEGYQYCIGIKIVTLPKFKNKQFMWDTNSTYICDFLPDKDLTEKGEKEFIIDGLQDVFASALD